MKTPCCRGERDGFNWWKFAVCEDINNCISSCYSKLRLLYQHRHEFDRKTKIMLCNTLILSRLDFCDIVYGPHLRFIEKQRIQKLQNSCLRLIFGIRKYEHISHFLKLANWINMQDRRFYHSVLFFNTLIKNKSPTYLYSKISFRTDVHTLNLRFRGLLTPPLHSLQLFKRSFSYTVTKYLNNLPTAL